VVRPRARRSLPPRRPERPAGSRTRSTTGGAASPAPTPAPTRARPPSPSTTQPAPPPDGRLCTRKPTCEYTTSSRAIPPGLSCRRGDYPRVRGERSPSRRQAQIGQVWERMDQGVRGLLPRHLRDHHRRCVDGPPEALWSATNCKVPPRAGMVLKVCPRERRSTCLTSDRPTARRDTGQEGDLEMGGKREGPNSDDRTSGDGANSGNSGGGTGRHGSGETDDNTGDGRQR
jgi:hypothetical protein